MKKKAIALLLSIVLTAGSIGAGIPVLAAETTAEEAASVEEESEQEQIDEAEEAASVEEESEQEQVDETEVTEEADTGETAVEEEIPAEEEEPEQEDVTDAVEQDAETEDTVIEEEAEPEAKEDEETAENTYDTSSAATEEIAVIEEVIETAEVKEAEMAGDVVDSGTCGENATWTLTGTGDNLTLTISGSGEMEYYDQGGTPWYSKRTKITTVIIEDGITSISNYAFYSLSKLTNVLIPDTVNTIKSNAFNNCVRLKRITIPDSIDYVEYNVFDNCISFSEIHINSLQAWLRIQFLDRSWYVDHTELSYDLYLNDTRLTNCIIPDGTEEIQAGAFYNCRSLTSVTIPDGVTNIGNEAFSGCSSLGSVTIPDSVTSIGNEAFSGCSSLGSVTIPDGVTSIGSEAFFDCSSLISVTIPDGVTSVERGTFSGCSNLKNIAIPESVTSIGDRTFENCRSLTNINLPNDLLEISDRLFFDCVGLTNISLPDGVIRIGSQAFSNCNGLTSITIPNEVVQIDDLAFSQCDSLKKIVIRENVIRLGEYPFTVDGGMQADVYTTKGCTADQYFCALNLYEEQNNIFTMHYPCDPDGHTYGDWKVVAEPTCKDSGLKERRCTNCGDIQTESIPVTSNHIWNNDYTVDVEPTYDVAGIESIHCSVCNTTKAGSEKSIPRLPKPLDLITVSGIEKRIHSGKDQILDLVVIDGGTVLVEGNDYTVVYENNVDVGIAKVTINGIGHYTGTYSETFPILPAASSKVTCTNVASGIKVSWNKVEGATSYYVYRDDKLLFRTSALEVTDKEIKYDTGTKFTYRVIASTKGVGNSTKSRTAKMFRLMPVGIKSLTNPSAGKMTVNYDKCKGCYGYVVRYGLNSDMSDANVITVKGEDTLSRTFSGMKKGKTYYVQVRTYMLEYGVRYYSGYCTTKTITIKK